MQNNQALKSKFRQEIREGRKRVANHNRKQAEHQISTQLSSNINFVDSHHIACFLSFDGEISTNTIIDRIICSGRHCYLPKIKPLKPNQLWFMPYHLSSEMKNNRFGIAEVDLRANHAKRLSELDLVLVPLVAFDLNGNRLGMGGGFYDATFAHLRKSTKRPKFIGLAWQNQLLDKLPSDPWDLPLDGVCTEQRFYSFT